MKTSLLGTVFIQSDGETPSLLRFSSQMFFDG